MFDLDDDSKSITNTTPPKDVLKNIQRIDQLIVRWLRCIKMAKQLEEECGNISMEVSQLMYGLGVINYTAGNGSAAMLVQDYSYDLDKLYETIGPELWSHVVIDKEFLSQLSISDPRIVSCVTNKTGEYSIKVYSPNRE